MRRSRLITQLVLATALVAGHFARADVTLTIDAEKPCHDVSPRLIGIFFEDINFGADGGLCAELVKNGSFEFPNSLMGWACLPPAGGTPDCVEVLADRPAHVANPHYLRVDLAKSGGPRIVVNEGFRGMGIRAGEKYRFAAIARAVGKPEPVIKMRLIDEQETAIGSAEIGGLRTDWSAQQAVLTADRTCAKARLQLEFSGDGTVDVDDVSVQPERTWKNRPNGLRADIVQALAELRPAFLRFPGGCIVEGSQLRDRYQWKHTLGEQGERPISFNRWNTVFQHRPAPDYYQSHDLGFHEFFQLTEDIGAEPLPIINCGMACQFQSGELVPLEELQPYVQDALDLIEFANGSATSDWGAKRAAMGHRQPFHLKLIGVGNEQWGPEYFRRYVVFARALKQRHPEIELVSAAGPFPADEKFRYAWPRLRELRADLVDEHCYAMPDWFLRAATRYDGYDRHGPKVFMGEYAAQSVDITSPDNRNNLRCALAEAAFLTGIERNSDVVIMSSYAPLLAHVDAWQWRPNLIWFDNLNVVRTPNYYVQQLFSRHRGDAVLPLALDDSRPVERARGRIGLATVDASAEFKDLRIACGDKTVFTGSELSNTSPPRTFGGQWEMKDGVIRQSAPVAANAMFGDYSWGDCTITLKARRVGGKAGIGLIMRNSPGGSFLQWTLGGIDGQYRLESHLANHSEDRDVIQQSPGVLEDNRWYDLKVELMGPQIRCYVDGTLVHDAIVAAPNIARLFAVAGRDRESKQLILKVVNPTGDATSVRVVLKGLNQLAAKAQLIVLSGNPENENSFEQPQRVVPRTTDLDIPGSEFRHTFPANSLSIIRIDAP